MAQLSGSRLAQFTLGHARSALVGRSWARSWGAGICLPLGLGVGGHGGVVVGSHRVREVRRIQATTGARPVAAVLRVTSRGCKEGPATAGLLIERAMRAYYLSLSVRWLSSGAWWTIAMW